MEALFAELYGKQTGANGGLAGSQDISFPSRHFFSGAILAGATAIAAGAALACQLRGNAAGRSRGLRRVGHRRGNLLGSRSTMPRSPSSRSSSSARTTTTRCSPRSSSGRRSTTSANASRPSACAARRCSATTRWKSTGRSSGRSRARACRRRARRSSKPIRIAGAVTTAPRATIWSATANAAEVEAWKRNCPISLLRKPLAAREALPSAGRWRPSSAKSPSEIARCFAFAKSSPFPAAPDWKALNVSPDTPMADKLLAEVEVANFDAQQESRRRRATERLWRTDGDRNRSASSNPQATPAERVGGTRRSATGTPSTRDSGRRWN